MRSDAPPDNRNRADAASDGLQRVLALVSDEYAIALRWLLDQRAHVTRHTDPAGLQRASDLPYDSFLLEWTEVVRSYPFIRDREAHLWHAVRRAAVPALILLDLAKDPIPPLLELGISGASGLLLQGVHDLHPAQFAQRLFEAGSTHRIRLLLPSIAALTESAPEPFRRTLAILVQNPARFASVRDLACATHCTSRTLERHLHALGISSPRALFSCVRLAHLHVRTSRSSPSPNALARTLGFHSTNALLNAVLRITACGTVSEFLALPPERVAQRLTAALRVES